jgi:hypothetical protein
VAGGGGGGGDGSGRATTPTEASKMRDRWQSWMNESKAKDFDAKTRQLDGATLKEKGGRMGNLYLGRRARKRTQGARVLGGDAYSGSAAAVFNQLDDARIFDVDPAFEGRQLRGGGRDSATSTASPNPSVPGSPQAFYAAGGPSTPPVPRAGSGNGGGSYASDQHGGGSHQYGGGGSDSISGGGGGGAAAASGGGGGGETRSALYSSPARMGGKADAQRFLSAKVADGTVVYPSSWKPSKSPAYMAPDSETTFESLSVGVDGGSGIGGAVGDIPSTTAGNAVRALFQSGGNGRDDQGSGPSSGMGSGGGDGGGGDGYIDDEMLSSASGGASSVDAGGQPLDDPDWI